MFSQASRATTAGRRHRQLAFNTKLEFSKLTVYSFVDSLPFLALIEGQLLDSVDQQIKKRKDLCLIGRQL